MGRKKEENEKHPGIIPRSASAQFAKIATSEKLNETIAGMQFSPFLSSPRVFRDHDVSGAAFPTRKTERQIRVLLLLSDDKIQNSRVRV